MSSGKDAAGGGLPASSSATSLSEPSSSSSLAPARSRRPGVATPARLRRRSAGLAPRIRTLVPSQRASTARTPRPPSRHLASLVERTIPCAPGKPQDLVTNCTTIAWDGDMPGHDAPRRRRACHRSGARLRPARRRRRRRRDVRGGVVAAHPRDRRRPRAARRRRARARARAQSPRARRGRQPTHTARADRQAVRPRVRRSPPAGRGSAADASSEHARTPLMGATAASRSRD